ncbi:MAG: winged helix-turn-helix transcriptional regulator [Crenarchaeota archaeon]|nr:winged helix-turn-helix transcriptional regulator [Thermoproteota archaeon]
MTKRILKVLSKSHALEILESLSKKPMRFVDLKEVCKSNRTRTSRLKELKEEGLIRVSPKLTKDRAYTFYEITTKGRRALKLIEKLINLPLEEKGKS